MMGKRLMLVIGLLVYFMVSSIMAGELKYPQVGGVTFLDEVRMGIVYELDSGDTHSDIAVPVVRYQEEDYLDIALSVGLSDYQEIKFSGSDDWFYDLNVSVALEADIIKLACAFPGLNIFAEKLPDWTYCGIGQLVSFDDEHKLDNCWIVKVSAEIKFE